METYSMSFMEIEIDRLQEDILSTQMPNRHVDLVEEPGESDDDTKVNFDEERFLKQRNTAHVTPPSFAYTPPLPCLFAMDPSDTLSMGDKDLDTLLTGDREIDLNPFRDVENHGCFLADDPIPIPNMSNEPLGNSDSMFRSVEASDFLLEELVSSRKTSRVI
ncbi:hypothetical protein Tco_0778588 [Tanacetum coccineum]